MIARALDRAAGTTSADPGPVQLDVPLREPLVESPVEGDPDASTPDPALEGRPGGAPWTRVTPRDDAWSALALPPGARTLVVAGHGGAVVPAGAGLPAGIPVLAEPSSPLWSDPAGGHLLRAAPWLLGAVLDDPADHPLRPDHVVVLGRPTLHRGVSRLLADPRVSVHAVPATAPGDGRLRPGWTDVHGAVTAVGALPDPATWAPDAAFATAWAELDARAADAADASGAGDDGTTLAGAVVAALPAGALLVVGASNPIRDVALGAVPRGGITVLSARGVSGIDGAVALATGAALAHAGPTVALLGDLTFLHDAGGLLVGPHEPRGELTIVVANDDGGGIFSVLEQGAPPHAAAFERVFGTPHGTDLAALCRAHGIPHRRLGTGSADLGRGAHAARCGGDARGRGVGGPVRPPRGTPAGGRRGRRGPGGPEPIPAERLRPVTRVARDRRRTPPPPPFGHNGAAGRPRIGCSRATEWRGAAKACSCSWVPTRSPRSWRPPWSPRSAAARSRSSPSCRR